MFENLQIEQLTREMNGQKPDDNQPEKELPDEEVTDQDEGQDVDDEVQDTDEGDEETIEGDDSDEDEGTEQSDKDSEKDPVIEWTTSSGEKFSVPKSELQNGYMRTQDYTHKTQALAQEREQVTQAAIQKFHEVQAYAKELGQLSMQDSYIQQLEQEIQRTDRNSDPIGYNAVVSDLLMARQQREGLASRIAQVQNTRTQEQQQLFAQAQQQAIKALSDGPQALPNFGPELVKRMNDTGKQYGLTEQELGGITDPKYIRILHDAMLYRELQAKKPAAVSKAKAAPSKQVRSQPAQPIERVAKNFDRAPTIEGMAALLNAQAQKRK